MDFDVELWTACATRRAGASARRCRPRSSAPTCAATRSRSRINNARAAGIGHLLRFESEGRARLPAAGGTAGRHPVQSALRRAHRRGEANCAGCTACWARCSHSAAAGWTAYVFTRQRRAGASHRPDAGGAGAAVQRQDPVPAAEVRPRLAADSEPASRERQRPEEFALPPVADAPGSPGKETTVKQGNYFFFWLAFQVCHFLKAASHAPWC